MIKLRVSGTDRDEVGAWVQLVAGLAADQTEGQVYQTPVREGRKGEYLAYINVCTRPAEVVVRTRLPRKSGSLPARRRRR